MALNWSLSLVSLALTIVDYFLEQERACCEYGEYRPDFQGTLGARGGDVCGWLVGTGGFAWLAETRCVWPGGGEGTSYQCLRLA
jgi:hypothetical protein